MAAKQGTARRSVGRGSVTTVANSGTGHASAGLSRKTSLTIKISLWGSLAALTSSKHSRQLTKMPPKPRLSQLDQRTLSPRLTMSRVGAGPQCSSATSLVRRRKFCAPLEIAKRQQRVPYLLAAVITRVEVDKSARVELYDSGATRHLSPYRDDSTTYHALEPPLLLKAENGQRFPTVGTGTIVVSTANGSSQSDLTLEGVLYAPSVGYTLTSLGTLDTIGYSIKIGSGHLEIQSPRGDRLALIMRDPRGLYRVSHEGEGS